MKKIVILVSAAIALAGCSQDVLVDNAETKSLSDKIEFGLSMADNATKASRASGNTFVNGDKIAVMGYQTVDGSTSLLFNDQVVSFDGADWKYAPAKYWDKSSKYDFYAMFPQTLGHSFSADRLYTIADFTVSDSAKHQVDVMIAKQKLNATPYNTVDFVFTHMLSNVNFYFNGVASSVSAGISTVDILSFDVEGLNSKGSYVQTGWNAGNVAEGMWVINTESAYNMPEVTDKQYKMDGKVVDLATDLLLMPQDIQSQAVISIKYRLNYTDGSSVTFKKSVPFAAIQGKNAQGNVRAISSWYPATRYNYLLTVNPSKSNVVDGSIKTDTNDVKRPIEVTIIEIPDTDGDLEDEYWVDEDGDGKPDYPLVWDDPDGDGIQELYPDHDGDGIPDYRDDDDPHSGDADGDGIPDDLWIDTDGDGESDTEVTRVTPVILPVDPSIPTDTNSVNYPDTCYVDYNGGVDGYDNPNAWIVVGDLTNDDINDDYMIDIDGDGVGDIAILWKDIDGDGKLEGIADKDGDGVLTEADTYDGDGVDRNGKPNYYDVIMVDTDGDGEAETELEREKTVKDPEIEVDTMIEFSATVDDWTETYNSEMNITQ